VTRFTLAPIVLALACGASYAQPEAGAPAFEVASVKPTQHGRGPDGWSFSDIKVAGPGRLVATNASLEECIRWAYQVKKYQIYGPDWLNADDASYDIEAKTSPEKDRAQIRLMLQALLAERLGLRLHRETRMLPIFEVVVAKNGPRLQAAGADAKGGLTSQGGRDGVRVTGQKATMAELAERLSLDVERPVFDKTDLQGSYAIQLDWSRGEGSGPSVFTAIQDQLGLKLQPSKGPVEVLVIDHAERVPAAN
jgi:uncharacterized protein (TIGR03435 family)